MHLLVLPDPEESVLDEFSDVVTDDILARQLLAAIQRGDTKAAKNFASRALAIDANDVAAGIAMVQVALQEKEIDAAERILAAISRLPSVPRQMSMTSASASSARRKVRTRPPCGS